MPAYEDAFYYLWREHQLPVNVTAADSKAGNPRERARTGAGVRARTGGAGGLRAAAAAARDGNALLLVEPALVSAAGALLLVAGDSPIGYRLPLDSLPWVADDDIEYDHELDPFAERETLPAKRAGGICSTQMPPDSIRCR